MADTLSLTQNYDIELILPDLMWDEMTEEGPDELLEALPLVHEKEDLLIYEQHENGYGLLSLRGLGGQPDVTTAPGIRRYAVAPGYYGERCELPETEMTKSRDPGSPNLPAKPEERIAIMTQYQAAKSVNRIRQVIADFLRTGKFTNKSASGRVVHTDQIENYTTIAIATTSLPKTGGTTGPAWSDAANAKPLTDLMAIKLELEFGTSSEFGPNSKLLCNPDVIVDLFKTSQVQDTYRDRFGATMNSPQQLDELLVGFGLPKLVPYKKGYFPTLDNAIKRESFTRILPSRSMIWLGSRPKGQKLGKFVLSRNMGVDPPAGTGQSPYRVASADKYAWAEGIHVLLEYYAKMPFRWELDVCMNGGPVVHFGSAAAGLSYT